jgi:hypothetical protein
MTTPETPEEFADRAWNDGPPDGTDYREWLAGQVRAREALLRKNPRECDGQIAAEHEALLAARDRIATLEAALLEAWQWLAGRHPYGRGSSPAERVAKAETVIATNAEWEEWEKAHPGEQAWASEALGGGDR